MNAREHQLAVIQGHIREWHEDAAECQRRADGHLAEAAEATERARRWEVVHDAIRFGIVPNLDGCPDTDTEEVPF
jgi:hypothetical protein